MKTLKLLFILLILVLTSVFVINLNIAKPDKKGDPFIVKPSQALSAGKVKTSLFVPYWSIPGSGSYGTFDQLLYFGISPDDKGKVKNDQGFLNLPEFITPSIDRKEKLLVLRMLNSKTNFTILKDQKIQDELISQTLAVVKKFGFSGVVLDLELSALPFESLIKQINEFNNRFYKTLKKENLKYQITIYGDVYYRIRPFDVKTLAKSADKIMVMAYDLHKASGNPGPNFPLNGKEKYGYDYTELVARLLNDVPHDKIEVIFGLYGYDWQVNDKNTSLAGGKPMSYLEIKNNILDNCAAVSCKVVRDELSKETQVIYVSEGIRHIIWFEDLKSASKKQEYLQTKGIYNYSMWAHSYF